MAKSLLCKDCGLLLRNVAEAQNHNEVTGHANFEETTVAIKVQKCTACGKPCRTDAERDMHKRFTGHSEFVEQEAGAELDTEKEMKDARQAIQTDDDLIRQAVGKPAKAKPAEAAAGASTSGGDVEMVAAEVDPKLLAEMEEMGFPRNRAVRAIWHSKATTSIEAAVNWVVEHEADMDIDEPLMVSKADAEEAAKEPLDPVEARRKAEELMRKAKEKREKEEREMERLRELERIRAGKEMQKAKEKEEEVALKRVIEQRKREKEQDARAREALRLKLEEDRKERRRKLGLPEELTEEEKAKEAEKKKKQEDEEVSKKAFNFVKPISTLSKVRDQLVALKKSSTAAGGAGEEAFKTACGTMLKYLANIGGNPAEEKFRTIKTSNAAFQQRVAAVPGAVAVLEACGFESNGEALQMPTDKVNVELLSGVCNVLNDAVTNPFFGAL